MKNLSIVVMLCSYTALLNGQWNELNTGTNVQLNSVYTVTSDLVYIVGNSGVILKTTNGGLDWTQQTPVASNLQNVFFSNLTDGFAVGDNGVILKTTDAGLTWIPQNSGVNTSLKKVWFSGNSGIVITSGTYFLNTSDGGNSWNIETISSNYRLYDIDFSIGGNRGVMVGGGIRTNPIGTEKIIYETTDGGINWAIEKDSGKILKHSSYKNDDLLYILDDENLYRRINGEWEPRGEVGGGSSCLDMHFSGVNGAITGALGLFRSVDGGLNFANVLNGNFKALSFADDFTGYIAGEQGKVYKTINGGGLFEIWIPLNTGTAKNIKSVCAIDSSNVFAAGDEGIILKSTDGGVSWEQKTIVNYNLTGISFGDLNHGSAVGIYGINRTTDGGLTWFSQNVNLTAPFEKVWCIGPNRIFVTTVNYDKHIVSSSDGGETWDIFSDPEEFWYNDISFVDSLNGVIAGGGARYIPPNIFVMVKCWRITSDGGQSWQRLTTDNQVEFGEVSCASPPWVFAFSQPTFIYSANNGHTWTNSGSTGEYVSDIFFHNSNVGYFASYTGLFQTTNKGASWIKLHFNNFPLNALSFADVTTGYAVGPDGVILKRITAGSSAVSSVDDAQETVVSYLLAQNYPNPFNPTTTISYSVPKYSNVTIKIFNVLGQEIASLVNEEKPAGRYEVVWNAEGFTSGIYFYTINAESFFETRKMILLK